MVLKKSKEPMYKQRLWDILNIKGPMVRSYLANCAKLNSYDVLNLLTDMEAEGMVKRTFHGMKTKYHAVVKE